MTTATVGALAPQLTVDESSTAQIFAPDFGRELQDLELEEISGGRTSDQVYETALGVAVGFATAAVAITASPIIIGALAFGSFGGSAIAVWSQLRHIHSH